MPFWKRERLSPDEKASRDAGRAAQSALKQAEFMHDNAVKEAQKQLDKSRKQHDLSGITAAEAELARVMADTELVDRRRAELEAALGEDTTSPSTTAAV